MEHLNLYKIDQTYLIIKIYSETQSSKNTCLSILGKYCSSERRTPSGNTIGVPAGIKWPPIVNCLSFETRTAKVAVRLILKVSSNTCQV